MGPRDYRLAAALLASLCVAGAVRLSLLSSAPLTDTERAALASSPLCAAGLTGASGDSALGLRLGSAVAGTLAVALAALAGQRLAGAGAAVWAGVLVALSPMHTLASRSAGPEAPLVLLLLTAVWLVAGLDSKADPPRAALAGIAVGTLAASGVTAFAVAAVVVFTWLAWRPERRTSAALTLAAAAASGGWLAQAGLARSPLDFGEIPPWIPQATASGVLRCAGASFTRVVGLEYHLLVPQARQVLPLTGFFVALMLWGAARLPLRPRVGLLAGAIAPVAVGALLAFGIERVFPLQALRLVAAFPFVALLMAIGLAALRGKRAWLAGTAVVATLAAFLALALAR